MSHYKSVISEEFDLRDQPSGIYILTIVLPNETIKEVLQIVK